MAAVKSSALLIVLIILFASAESAHHASAPAPAADCSSVIMDMADCLSFVSSDGKASKPEKSCCSGLQKVLKTNAKCLCEAFKTSASLGVTLNVTKALTLPAACNTPAPSFSNCGLSLTPAGAPAVSPAAAGGSESGVQPPAAAPGNSASPVQQVSVLLAGVLPVLALLFSAF